MDYSKLADEQLCQLAQEKDEKAITHLLARYKHPVTAMARTYFLSSGDVDDLIQEGMIGLFKAYLTFDSTKDVTFKSYAYTCVKTSIFSAIKRDNRKKNLPLNNYVSLSGFDDGDNDKLSFITDVTADPVGDVIQREEAKELSTKIKEVLSDLENKILHYYLDGFSYAEIGELINKETKSVDNAIQRIRKKVNTILNEMV
ncbi:MAG: sigma-70 family RNA polymerase sigma factor [Clostridia bacterium]|nr:sigma-70 family RNA polymerase sigma factor [Clostridia bacterium]